MRLRSCNKHMSACTSHVASRPRKNLVLWYNAAPIVIILAQISRRAGSEIPTRGYGLKTQKINSKVAFFLTSDSYSAADDLEQPPKLATWSSMG